MSYKLQFHSVTEAAFLVLIRVLKVRVSWMIVHCTECKNMTNMHNSKYIIELQVHSETERVLILSGGLVIRVLLFSVPVAAYMLLQGRSMGSLSKKNKTKQNNEGKVL